MTSLRKRKHVRTTYAYRLVPGMPNDPVRIDFDFTDEQTSVREGAPDTARHGKGQNKQVPNLKRNQHSWVK